MKLVGVALLAFVTACSTRPGEGTGSSAAAPSASAPEPPAHEAAMYPAKKPLLDGLAVLDLVPADADLVAFARSIDALEGVAGAGLAEARVRDAILAELDEDTLAFSKDLGEASAWKKRGVDTTRPVGYALLDAATGVEAAYLPIADAAAWKAFLETRKRGRDLREEGAVTVLGAKTDVTRAVVVRDGYAIVLRAGASYESARAEAVPAAVDRLSKLVPDASLRNAPRFADAVRGVAFGELVGAYADATYLVADERQRIAQERFRVEREDADEGRKGDPRKGEAKKARLEHLDATQAKVDSAQKALEGTFAVFGVDAVGGQLLAKGTLVSPTEKPIALGPASPLPPAFAALRTTSLEGWGNAKPFLLEYLVGGTYRWDSRMRNLHELVADEDLTGDVAYLARDTVAAGLVDPAKVKEKLGRMGDGWTLDATSDVWLHAGVRYRVAGGFLLVTSDEAFATSFPDAVPGAPTPTTSGALDDLVRIEGTSALFRVRPFQRNPLGRDFELGGASFDGPCGMGSLLGGLGMVSKEQGEARGKACKKLVEIDDGVSKRKTAAEGALSKAIGTVELVAKPEVGRVMIYGVLSSEAGTFDALVKSALDGFASGAPTADETKQRKALLAEIEAIDEEGRKAFDTEMSRAFEGFSAGGRLGVVDDTGIGSMSALRGLGVSGAGTAGLGAMGARGSSVGIGGVGSGSANRRKPPPPADGKTRKPAP